MIHASFCSQLSQLPSAWISQGALMRSIKAAALAKYWPSKSRSIGCNICLHTFQCMWYFVLAAFLFFTGCPCFLCCPCCPCGLFSCDLAVCSVGNMELACPMTASLPKGLPLNYAYFNHQNVNSSWNEIDFRFEVARNQDEVILRTIDPTSLPGPHPQERCAAKGACFLYLTVITSADAEDASSVYVVVPVRATSSASFGSKMLQWTYTASYSQSHSKIASPNGCAMFCPKILTFVSCLFGVPAQRRLDGVWNHDYGLVENFRWPESGGCDGYMVIRWLVCSLPILPSGLPRIFRPLSRI